MVRLWFLPSHSSTKNHPICDYSTICADWTNSPAHSNLLACYNWIWNAWRIRPGSPPPRALPPALGAFREQIFDSENKRFLPNSWWWPIDPTRTSHRTKGILTLPYFLFPIYLSPGLPPKPQRGQEQASPQAERKVLRTNISSTQSQTKSDLDCKYRTQDFDLLISHGHLISDYDMIRSRMNTLARRNIFNKKPTSKH